MDQDVIRALTEAEIDATFKIAFPLIAILTGKDDTPLPIEDEVLVVSGTRRVSVGLKKVSALFVGDVKPPSFARGPTPEYMPFFILIERTAAQYCEIVADRVKDAEFERIYRLLKRRPDGRDSHPLFSHIQAAMRLYMSLRNVSEEEYEEVLGRLALSAKHFAEGYSSTNYLRLISSQL